MIRLYRSSHWADRLRTYKVILDDEVIGDVRNGQSADFDVPAGHHTLYLKVDWCRSKAVEFDTTGTDTVEFDCGSNLGGFMFFFATFYVLFKRNDYMKLQLR